MTPTTPGSKLQLTESFSIDEDDYRVDYDQSVNWPRISIVTPSYNQGPFIETTIRSILLQNYPNLEYIIMDGGSTDNTVSIIKKYEDQLAYWVSEPDKGQSHAINKGIERATGDVFNWINSDDVLAPGALKHIALEFIRSSAQVVVSPTYFFNEKGIAYKNNPTNYQRALFEILNSRGLNQMGMYWNLERVKELNGVNATFTYSMDLDLWKRYLLTFDLTAISGVEEITGYFRLHEDSKTGESVQETTPLFELENNGALWNYATIAGPKYLKAMKVLYPDVESKVLSENIYQKFDPETLRTWLTNLFFVSARKAFYRNDFGFAWKILSCIDPYHLPLSDHKDLRSYKRWSSIRRWL